MRHVGDMKRLKLVKWQSEVMNRWNTDNATAKVKRTKRQGMSCKTLHRTLNIEQHKSHWKQTMIYRTLHRTLNIEQHKPTENKQWSTQHYTEH